MLLASGSFSNNADAVTLHLHHRARAGATVTGQRDVLLLCAQSTERTESVFAALTCKRLD